MQNRLVFFLIVIAVILAIAGFLLVSFLTRSPETTTDVPGEQVGEEDGTVPVGIPVEVDNTTVFLQTAQEKAVTLSSEEPPAAEPTVDIAPPTPEPTPVVIEPTQPLVTQPPPDTSAPVTAGGQQIVFIDYVVQANDTLYSITEKQKTSIELMSVHGISSEEIVPGATLRLPVANPAYCSGASHAYVVRPGDNVFRIAQTFNTTTQAIASANGLGADFRIDIAQVLCIP